MAASGTRGGTIVEVRRDLAALREIVPQWEALAAEAAEPNPFYEPWLLLPALEAFGAHPGFCAAAVWQDGKLAALFPMQLEPRYRGLPLRVLRSWRHRSMLLCTPLVRPREASRAIAALLEARLAPVVEFDWMPAGGPFYGALSAIALEQGLPWMVTDAYARAVLVRSRDPRGRFNSNMRNNLRRCEARLAACGRVQPVRLAPDGDVAAWTEDFIRLEASGWKGRAGTAVACRADERRFVTEAFAEAFRRGRLVITGLDLDGRPLSRHCMFIGDDGAFTFKIAYDEAYEKCSPGLLGEVENVRQFMEQPGPRWLDSNTAAENESYGRVWKDRRTVQRVALGAHGAGRFAVAALPLLRLAKRWLRPSGRGDAPEQLRPARSKALVSPATLP
jgi:hypothetical protein